MASMTRINVGCGMTPTEGWMNLDNSPSLRLSKFPFVAEVLHRLGLLDNNQFDYVGYCRSNRIKFADGTRRIPVADGGADVVYASHVIDLLDRVEVKQFLAEARRALRPGGTRRIVVPDRGTLLAEYPGGSLGRRLLLHVDEVIPADRGRRPVHVEPVGVRTPGANVRAATAAAGGRRPHAQVGLRRKVAGKAAAGVRVHGSGRTCAR